MVETAHDDREVYRDPLVRFLLPVRESPEAAGPVVPHRARGGVRVVVLTHEVTRGGRAKSSLDLATSLAALGYRVTCLAHPRFPVPEHSDRQLAEAGAELQLLGAGRVRSPLTVWRVLDALKRIRPDVLITHSIQLAGPLALMKRHLGSPRLIFARRGFRYPSGLGQWLLERGAPGIDAVACISHAVAECWRRVEPSWDMQKVVVVHNGVPVPERGSLPSGQQLPQELGLTGEARLIGTMGRMAWDKGHQYLIRAMPAVLGECPAARLLIAGDGPYLVELKRLSAALGLAERVHFLGWREDINTVLAALEVFVHPSLLEAMTYRDYAARWRRMPIAPSLSGEGFGRTVAEAGAVGLPVVVTDSGGHREIVVHGQTGLLVPVADPGAVADAVGYLLAHPEQARAMGRAARARIQQRFSLEALGGRYDRLIQALLGG